MKEMMKILRDVAITITFIVVMWCVTVYVVGVLGGFL